MKKWIFLLLIANSINFLKADSWTTKTDMPTPRRNHAIGVVNGKVYVIGGDASSSCFSVNEEYDPATNTWTTRTPMPGGPRTNMAAGVVNGKIYVIGGQYPGGVWLNRNEEYNPSADTVGGTPWTTKAPMPTSRDALAIGVVNNRIYAIGGIKYQSDWIYYSINEEYDPATNTWTTKAPMPTARCGHRIDVVNGKIYAIGGGRGTSTFSVNEEYDPSADTIGGAPWTLKAPMPTARTTFAIGVVENKIYTIGGGNVVPAVTTNEMYNPETNSWETKLAMPTERAQFAAGAVNDKIYAVGGMNGSTGNWHYLSINEEYNPATNDATPPNKPYITKGKKINSDVQLTWGKIITDTLGNPENIKYYVVYRGTSPSFIPGPLDSIGSVNSSDTSFTDVGVLSSSQDYYYLVKAVDMANNKSKPSNTGFKFNKFFNENAGAASDKNRVSLPWFNNSEVKKF